MSRRLLLVLASLLALPGCDSTTPLRADLGQPGDPPAIDASFDGVARTITFTPPSGGALPADWDQARSIRVLLGASYSPLERMTGGLRAFVPATTGFTEPLDGKPAEMIFVVDGDRAWVARVTFK